MKLNRLVAVLVVLLAGGLGLACDQALPTATWNEELTGKGEENWRVPQPCPAGTSPQFAHGCIPQAPTGQPIDQPPA